MTTINVIIPKGGTTTNKAVPLLTPHLQAIARNKLVTWHFHSEDPNVKRVRVRFKDPDAKFFPDTGDETQMVQSVVYRKNAADPVKYPGQSLIWGAAPDYPNHEKDKYWVEGLDDKDQVIAELDPYILTTKPG